MKDVIRQADLDFLFDPLDRFVVVVQINGDPPRLGIELSAFPWADNPQVGWPERFDERERNVVPRLSLQEMEHFDNAKTVAAEGVKLVRPWSSLPYVVPPAEVVCFHSGMKLERIAS